MSKKGKVVTFLGKDTRFDGKLAFHGTIRIDGHFKGEITSGENLIVGEEGIIEANMHVSYVVIRGEIHGDITADQRVDIRAPGKVFGNIKAPSVVIDEGVIFEGTTQMYRAKEEGEGESHSTGPEIGNSGPPPSLFAIYGVVTDEKTGNPIRNATVTCKGLGKKETKTNASGYYEQINLKDGHWRLKIKAEGYKPANAKAVLSVEQSCEQNFSLKPK